MPAPLFIQAFFAFILALHKNSIKLTLKCRVGALFSSTTKKYKICYTPKFNDFNIEDGYKDYTTQKPPPQINSCLAICFIMQKRSIFKNPFSSLYVDLFFSQ